MTQFGIAQPVRRVEDSRLLKGAGKYTDDIAPAGTLHAILLRSPHASARITAIDTSAAKSLPGIRAIYTAADLKADNIGPLPCAVPMTNRDGTAAPLPPHPVLADGMVRHVGDPIACIVADTIQHARDAAEAVMVDYDLLPAHTDLATAMDNGVPQVWAEAGQNIAFDWEIGNKAETETELLQDNLNDIVKMSKQFIEKIGDNKFESK